MSKIRTIFFPTHEEKRRPFKNESILAFQRWTKNVVKHIYITYLKTGTLHNEGKFLNF